MPFYSSRSRKKTNPPARVARRTLWALCLTISSPLASPSCLAPPPGDQKSSASSLKCGRNIGAHQLSVIRTLGYRTDHNRRPMLDSQGHPKPATLVAVTLGTFGGPNGLLAKTYTVEIWGKDLNPPPREPKLDSRYLIAPERIKPADSTTNTPQLTDGATHTPHLEEDGVIRMTEDDDGTYHHVAPVDSTSSSTALVPTTSQTGQVATIPDPGTAGLPATARASQTPTLYQQAPTWAPATLQCKLRGSTVGLDTDCTEVTRNIISEIARYVHSTLLFNLGKLPPGVAASFETVRTAYVASSQDFAGHTSAQLLTRAATSSTHDFNNFLDDFYATMTKMVVDYLQTLGNKLRQHLEQYPTELAALTTATCSQLLDVNPQFAARCNHFLADPGQFNAWASEAITQATNPEHLLARRFVQENRTLIDSDRAVPPLMNAAPPFTPIHLVETSWQAQHEAETHLHPSMFAFHAGYYDAADPNGPFAGNVSLHNALMAATLQRWLWLHATSSQGGPGAEPQAPAGPQCHVITSKLKHPSRCHEAAEASYGTCMARMNELALATTIPAPPTMVAPGGNPHGNLGGNLGHQSDMHLGDPNPTPSNTGFPSQTMRPEPEYKEALLHACANLRTNITASCDQARPPVNNLGWVEGTVAALDPNGCKEAHQPPCTGFRGLHQTMAEHHVPNAGAIATQYLDEACRTGLAICTAMGPQDSPWKN